MSEPSATVSGMTHPPFSSRSRFQARLVGEATRVARRLLARRLLADVDAAGVNRGDPLGPHDSARMIAVLRELVNAITALTPAPDQAPLTVDEESFATAGGVPTSAFTERGRRDAQDWVVWSALRADSDRRALDALLDRPITDIVPGLRDAIDAFPDSYTDLDRFTGLSTPHEALAGLSPIQWLLLGRDPATATTHIDELARLL